MHYTYEGLSPTDPEELRPDYRETLACFQRCLEANDSYAAEPEGNNVRIYAAHLQPLVLYGATVEDEGLGPEVIDESLLVVIVETRGLGKSGRGTRYDLDLFHLGKRHGSMSAPTEAFSYMTSFNTEDLEGYDPASADTIRTILEDTSRHGWFDLEEAWHWAEERYGSAKTRQLSRAEERGVRTARKVLADLVVRDDPPEEHTNNKEEPG